MYQQIKLDIFGVLDFHKATDMGKIPHGFLRKGKTSTSTTEIRVKNKINFYKHLHKVGIGDFSYIRYSRSLFCEICQLYSSKNVVNFSQNTRYCSDFWYLVVRKTICLSVEKPI